ncbi:hypothetical protein L484_002962 [Morus notabilis]|uniref:Uncharacterized protein n=1 Tax=Morus notabilis TaxID=981085 RepID=W9RKS9_9ROSA|nr:hypothetical protein L484_002962 [Morus notabilis]
MNTRRGIHRGLGCKCKEESTGKRSQQRKKREEKNQKARMLCKLTREVTVKVGDSLAKGKLVGGSALGWVGVITQEGKNHYSGGAQL